LVLAFDELELLLPQAATSPQLAINGTAIRKLRFTDPPDQFDSLLQTTPLTPIYSRARGAAWKEAAPRHVAAAR
jgi:hypothetical protein